MADKTKGSTKITAYDSVEPISVLKNVYTVYVV